MSAGAPFRLGRWRVEPTLLRLVDLESADLAERSVQIEPKVMSVLVLLAGRAGEVVSRDEILATVWAGRYVGEELARRAVYELRKALGDDARRPTYVESIPHAGYRLIAPLESVEPVEPAEPAEGAVGLAGRPNSTRRRLLAAGLAVVLAAAAAALWRSGALNGVAAPLRLTPLTASPGLEYDPALSPDGSRVAFVRAGDDGSGARLVVRLVAADSELELTALGDGGGDPTWSPDGTRVAFSRRRPPDAGWEVATVPALGGAPRPLVDLGPRRPYGLAWSPDGRRLAFGWAAEEGDAYALYLYSLADGVPRRLTDPPPAIAGDGAPSWSPDGRRIAFLRNHVGPVQDVWVVDADGGEARRVTPAARKIAAVGWTPGGTDLLATVYEAGDHRLARLPLDGGPPRRLAGVGEGAMGFSVATGGDGVRRLVYSRYGWRFTLWQLALTVPGRPATASTAGDREGSPGPKPVPELSSTRFDAELALSPDARRIAFSSTRSGGFEIWVAPLPPAPGEARRLTDFAGPWVGQPAWSPDGRWIAFAAAAGGDVDVWRVDPRGGLPQRLTDAPALDLAPSWSADGERLYFASNRTGSWEVWSRGVEPEAAAVRVTDGGGFRARESPDGRALWFSRRGEAGLWRMALPDGPPRLAIPELDRGSWGNWTPLDDGVLFAGKTPDHLSAIRCWREGHGSEEVARLDGWPLNPSLTADPRGTRLVWSQAAPGEVTSDLMLVEGF